MAIDAIVETVENLGSEHITYGATAGGASIAMRGNGGRELTVGEQVTLGADLAHVHLFDHDSGIRLEWVDDSASDAESPTALATASL
ncbi:TOBE domain-containing protein [Nocardia arizonensis]|uniref:TOBE domain-containing protein n=1 Tax=Nocardia arizonensis TaxID=1141647 RepID=UPI003FCD66AD